MKKILNIITQMEAGGAQGAAVRMSEALNQKGYKSETWFLYVKKPTYKEHSNIRCVCSVRPNGLISNIKMLYSLYKMILEENPDVVILHTHYANIIGGFIAKLAGVKTIIATHASLIELYPKLVRFVDAMFGIFGVYTKKVFVSPIVKDSFSSFPKKYFHDSYIVPNGISCPNIILSNDEVRQKYFLPENKKILISTGRLINYKNQKFLIDLMLNLPNDVVLVLAGDGEDRAFLEKYVADKIESKKVIFLGEVPPEDISSILNVSDVFVFASQTESFGFSVLEAMCVGLPIVCNDIPAMHYVVGDDGYIITTSLKGKWISVINDLLLNQDKRNEYKKKSILKSQEFTLEGMVQKYETLF